MKKQEDKIDTRHHTFGKIEKEEVTVEDKLEYLNKYITSHKKFSFKELLTKQKSKTQVVVTFLAILEMMKIGTIVVEQEKTFDDIIITSNV
jgi:segregation and condensation protein A